MFFQFDANGDTLYVESNSEQEARDFVQTHLLDIPSEQLILVDVKE